MQATATIYDRRKHSSFLGSRYKESYRVETVDARVHVCPHGGNSVTLAFTMTEPGRLPLRLFEARLTPAETDTLLTAIAKAYGGDFEHIILAVDRKSTCCSAIVGSEDLYSAVAQVAQQCGIDLEHS